MGRLLPGLRVRIDHVARLEFSGRNDRQGIRGLELVDPVALRQCLLAAHEALNTHFTLFSEQFPNSQSTRGWVELENLKPGERIHILNRKGGFGNTGSLELGRVLGWLVGDGTMTNGKAVLSFFGNDAEISAQFAKYVTELTTPLTQAPRAYTNEVSWIAERREARVQSERLYTLAQQAGVGAGADRTQ